LIAKKEGDTALFLSPLRHDPGAALKRISSFAEKADSLHNKQCRGITAPA